MKGTGASPVGICEQVFANVTGMNEEMPQWPKVRWIERGELDMSGDCIRQNLTAETCGADGKVIAVSVELSDKTLIRRWAQTYLRDRLLDSIHKRELL